MRLFKKLLPLLLGALMVLSLDSCFVAKSISKNSDNFRNISQKTYTAAEMANLKSTTTLFLLRKEDAKNRADFEKAIKSAWNLTDIKLIDYTELPNYQDGNYSFFTIKGYNTNVQGKTISYNIPHIYLTLETVGRDEDGEIQITDYCRIELFMDSYSMSRALSMDTKEAISDLYEHSNIKNWTPAMLGFYLNEVQQQLQNSKREWLYEATKNENALKGLARSTLYVPHYVLTKYNKWSGSETDQHDPEDLFDDYPYKYEIIDSDELSEKVLAGEARYVLDYVRSTTDNFIRVFDTEKGRIYQAYEGGEYNLKSKYIRRIAD